MTIDELDNLSLDEVVLITGDCDDLNTYHTYIIGDELYFMGVRDNYTNEYKIYTFLMFRGGQRFLCDFLEGISKCIENKKTWIRDKKLNELGI